MFCTECGNKLPDNARFCTKCGKALAQAAPQPAAQPMYQPAPQYAAQPVPQYAPQPVMEPRKINMTVNYPNGKSEIGYILVSPTEIVVVKKSVATQAMFGYLGYMLDRGKETLRFPISQIAFAEREQSGLNKNAFRITMNNGESFLFFLQNPKKNLPYLEAIIGNR